MRLYLLGAWLAHVEPCPDGPDRRLTARRYLDGKLLRRSRVQRVDARPRAGRTDTLTSTYNLAAVLHALGET